MPTQLSPRDALLEDIAYVLSCLAENCTSEARTALADVAARLDSDRYLDEVFRQRANQAVRIAIERNRERQHVDAASITWVVFRAILHESKDLLVHGALPRPSDDVI